MAPRFVAYLRVSTARQGRSGLGLDAQREAVRQLVANQGGTIIAPEFVEVESGKVNDRPKLAAALHRCRLTGAKLVVAKLDRLSRNAAFLLTLRDSGVEFVAADLPEVNTLTVGIMATVAQHERERIAQRTRDALAAAKARGTKLGGRREGAARIADYGAAGLAERQRRAAAHARDVVEALAAYPAGLSLNEAARRLNADGIVSARGVAGGWTATAVRRVLAKAGTDGAASGT